MYGEEGAFMRTVKNGCGGGAQARMTVCQGSSLQGLAQQTGLRFAERNVGRSQDRTGT